MGRIKLDNSEAYEIWRNATWQQTKLETGYQFCRLTGWIQQLIRVYITIEKLGNIAETAILYLQISQK